MDYEMVETLLGQIRDACNEGIRRARLLASGRIEAEPLTAPQVASVEQAIKDGYAQVKANVLPQLDVELE